jgi:hypothetical protein
MSDSQLRDEKYPRCSNTFVFLLFELNSNNTFTRKSLYKTYLASEKHVLPSYRREFFCVTVTYDYISKEQNPPYNIISSDIITQNGVPFLQHLKF